MPLTLSVSASLPSLLSLSGCSSRNAGASPLHSELLHCPPFSVARPCLATTSSLCMGLCQFSGTGPWLLLLWALAFCLRVLSRSAAMVRSHSVFRRLCGLFHSGNFHSSQVQHGFSFDRSLQLAWVYATTNMKIQIEIFCRIVAGYIWEGKVLANIWFFNLGYISGIKGLAFAQDLKLGIYCNVRTRNFSHLI